MALEVRLGGMTCKHEFLVVSTFTFGVLLGTDFLVRNAATMCYDTGTLCLRGSPVCELHSRVPLEAGVVRLEKAVTLMAAGVELLTAGVKRGAQYAGAWGVFTPNSELARWKGVTPAHSLVTVADGGTVPVQLMNPGDEAVELPAGTVLGVVAPPSGVGQDVVLMAAGAGALGVRQAVGSVVDGPDGTVMMLSAEEQEDQPVGRTPVLTRRTGHTSVVAEMRWNRQGGIVI